MATYQLKEGVDAEDVLMRIFESYTWNRQSLSNIVASESPTPKVDLYNNFYNAFGMAVNDIMNEVVDVQGKEGY